MSRLAAIALCLAGLLVLPRTATADAVPQTMLLIDGSGSMWGRLGPDGRAKIDIIRERIQIKVTAAGEQSIGIASFGHRRKSDCSDVEIIATPSRDQSLLSETLSKLNPRGKGPLAAALRETAAAHGQSRPANIVVVTDGIDNCRQDTCAAAADIAKNFPGIAIHMVSIDVDASETAQLACVAQVTAGTFHDAQTSDDVVAAIDAVAALALRPPAATAANPRPVIRDAATSQLQAEISLAEGGGPFQLAARWRVFQAGSAAALVEAEGPVLSAALKPGSYEVEANYKGIITRRPFAVSDGQITKLTLPLNAGRVSISVKDANALKPAATAAYLITVEPVIQGKARPSRAF